MNTHICEQCTSACTSLAACVMLISCLAYYSDMKMEAKFPYETFVVFHRTIQHHTLEDTTLRNPNSTILHGVMSLVIHRVNTQLGIQVPSYHNVRRYIPVIYCVLKLKSHQLSYDLHGRI
jgi:hypothetical protein